MADPNLQGHFPVRGLFQALAVAAMCLHEQATSRPLIADVVTALNFLASQTCGPVLPPERTELASPVSGCEQEKVNLGSATEPRQDAQLQQVKDATLGNDVRSKMGGDQSDAHTVRGIKVLRDTSRQPGWRAPAEGREREQAIAEARVWGESWKEKRGCVKGEGDCSDRASG